MKNSKKVLMIGPDINSQGGISSVIRLYKDSGLFDNDIQFLSTYKEGNKVYKSFIYIFFIIKYLTILITRSNIKLVHIHTASRGSFLRKFIALYIAIKVFNKQVSLHIHGAEFHTFFKDPPFLVRYLIKYALNKCDTILTVSNSWQAEITRICQNKVIKVLYNPILVKDECYRESKNINILFMGRLDKRKGVYDIIEAAKHVKLDNIKIYLYGDGNIDRFKKIVKDNNLENRIIMPGWISGNEKDKILRDADIFILPSYNEGLPVAILEAIANGLPVISTSVGGIPEAVEDNINGFLIESGDYIALAEKIEVLANDSDLRYKMGRESFRMAKEKFDIAIIAPQLQNLYKELLK